jgi:hypothetical protein
VQVFLHILNMTSTYVSMQPPSLLYILSSSITPDEEEEEEDPYDHKHIFKIKPDSYVAMPHLDKAKKADEHIHLVKK